MIDTDRKAQLEAHLRRYQIQTNRYEKDYEQIKKALDWEEWFWDRVRQYWVAVLWKIVLGLFGWAFQWWTLSARLSAAEQAAREATKTAQQTSGLLKALQDKLDRKRANMGGGGPTFKKGCFERVEQAHYLRNLGRGTFSTHRCAWLVGFRSYPLETQEK